MTYKYLFHLTSFNNVPEILKEKVLTYGRGKARGGYNEKQISFADFLSRYLEDFGDVCFEFKFENLFSKNKIYPFDYGVDEQYFYLPDGFPAWPFWECEWQAKRVKFEYSDINKLILFSDRLHKGIIKSIVDLSKYLNVGYEIIKFSELPESDYEFFIKRYMGRKFIFRRIKYGLYNNI